ncbi:MAG TPA: hypothetical protein VJN90_04975 [Candidatus Acidoferrales bacterium]|nr:hypothetical protein [Candidatus Acidoferrales bacterium]
MHCLPHHDEYTISPAHAANNGPVVLNILADIDFLPKRTRSCASHFALASRQENPYRHEFRNRVAKFRSPAENEFMFKEGQHVRVNMSGMQVGDVMFHAAVTDAVGNIVRQTSQDPPSYLVRLLFSFKGVNEVEVPENRIKAV